MAIESIGQNHSIHWTTRTTGATHAHKTATAPAATATATTIAPETPTEQLPLAPADPGTAAPTAPTPETPPSPTPPADAPTAPAPVDQAPSVDAPAPIHGRAHVMQTLHRMDRQIRVAIREAIAGMDGLDEAGQQALMSLEKDFRAELQTAFHEAGRGGSFELAALKTGVATALQDLLAGVAKLQAQYAPAPEPISDPTVPTEPTAPTDPTAPADPAAPADPTAPTAPTDPSAVDPVAPTTTEPAAPAVDAYA